ncbi:MAG: polysaccharide biosynthesis tyrosine autokinase [Cyclobacteriaceae bacterium]|nr:polysaccharide biosynthesis tyrosine autokinase [Cyclobacteriaceae bacterium]
MAEQLNWESKDNLEDIKILLAKVLRRWHWVAISFALAMAAAYLYIRYQDPVYVVNSSFISRKFDDRRNDVVPNISEFGGFSDRIEVFQQIPLLKSELRISETLRRLNFGVTYIVEGRLKKTELYKSTPFTVLTSDSSKSIPYEIPIYIERHNDRSFALHTVDAELNKKLSGKTYLFNIPQIINGWQFTIKSEQNVSMNPDYDYYFVVHNPRRLMNEYRSRLNVDWAFKGSAILNASISTKIPEKDLEFLSTYLEVVVDLGLEEKNEYLVNSIKFIDGYMLEIADTLLNYQNKIDKFRLNNREIISGSTLVIDKLNVLDESRANLLLEENYYDYIEEYIKKQKTEEVFAPNLIGITVPPLEELVGKYMEQKWEDKIDLNQANEKNPLVTKGNEQFERLEKNIYESVNNLKALNKEKIREIDKQINFYLRSIDDLHVEYRNYINMDRMKAIYEGLYNQLLTRKTDANISKASATSDYQLVTEANYSNVPIYPNKKKSYIIAIVLGLGLPIGFIFLLDFINPRIISKEDLKKYTNIPLIGSVGHFRGKTNLVVLNEPKSQVSESFRVIRANLEYIISDSKEARVILITSSISGEGKTFCSTNLAYTYANMGKKTLLIGADMRRPALAKNFGLERERGLSNYLSGQNELESIIYSSNKAGLDVIPGGHVPPNPAELLTSERMGELMEMIKEQYEVIIFDTPPIGLVSDTVELVKHSYTPILIVRQDVTYKKSLEAITEMYNAGKIKNLGIIVNDVNYTKYDYGTYYGQSYGYGSGEGYGYYDDENRKSFWRRFWRLQK